MQVETDTGLVVKPRTRTTDAGRGRYRPVLSLDSILG